MVFDRITLVNIYKKLKSVQDNDGLVRNILLNRFNKFNYRTTPRFKDLTALKQFINEKYPYVVFNEYSCATENENIWTLLAFEIYNRPEELTADLILENNKRRDIKIQPVSKHATFVNNIDGNYQSQKKQFQNSFVQQKIEGLFKTDFEINTLFKDFKCLAYLDSRPNYIASPVYIEVEKNKAYNTLIEKYYKATRTSDFPK